MDNKEKHIEEARNEGRSEANELRVSARERKNRNTKKINRLWLWFGVMILIFILLYWLWTIGLFEDVTGISNG